MLAYCLVVMVSLFSLSHVGLTLNGTEILRDISLEIPQGSVSAIVGPSGSGKSSLLRLLNRLETPTAGHIQFRGIDSEQTEIRSLRKRVGMVFQRPALFEGSVTENLRVADPQLDPGDVAYWLDQVGLGKALAEREASKLSGGEAQRLCLARALVVKPEVLLLDEPTASLDRHSVQLIEVLLADLADKGLDQIWVSHDPAQVSRMANSIFELPALEGTSRNEEIPS